MPAEIIIFSLVFALLGFCFYLIRKVGLGTLVGPLLYFAVGILLVGVSRAFHLTILSIGKLSGVTSHFWWHMSLFLGMVSLIIGIRRLDALVREPISSVKTGKDLIIILLVLAASAVSMILAQPLEPILAPILKGSIIEKFGLHHLFAVGIVITSAIYFYKSRSTWKTFFGVTVYPILAFLLLIGLQHLLVLLNNDLNLLGIPKPFFKEVERIVILSALAFLNYGFLRVALAIKARSTPTSSQQVTA